MKKSVEERKKQFEHKEHPNEHKKLSRKHQKQQQIFPRNGQQKKIQCQEDNQARRTGDETWSKGQVDIRDSGQGTVLEFFKGAKLGCNIEKVLPAVKQK